MRHDGDGNEWRMGELLPRARFFTRKLISNLYPSSHQDLTKQSYAFSSYAFTLLVVFFCQNTIPAILPKISALTLPGKPEAQGPGSTLWLGKYSLNLKQDFGPMQPKNEQTVQELVVEFVQFYANFKYDVDAIVPRVGAKVPKKALYLEKSSQVRKSGPWVHFLKFVELTRIIIF